MRKVQMSITVDPAVIDAFDAVTPRGKRSRLIEEFMVAYVKRQEDEEDEDEDYLR